MPIVFEMWTGTTTIRIPRNKRSCDQNGLAHIACNILIDDRTSTLTIRPLLHGHALSRTNRHHPPE
jgi:hypothetical protein